MRVSIIAAVAENGVIGKDNDLAWHLPDDMEFFKSTTLGRTVIMGRKNYESIPPRYRPLPKRINVVITRNKAYKAPGCEMFGNIEDALSFAERLGEAHAFIIGGGQIYTQALLDEQVDDMYITHVHHCVEGDTHFPAVDPEKWSQKLISEHPADERHAYPFTIVHYTRLAKD